MKTRVAIHGSQELEMRADRVLRMLEGLLVSV